MDSTHFSYFNSASTNNISQLNLENDPSVSDDSITPENIEQFCQQSLMELDNEFTPIDQDNDKILNAVDNVTHLEDVKEVAKNIETENISNFKKAMKNFYNGCLAKPIESVESDENIKNRRKKKSVNINKKENRDADDLTSLQTKRMRKPINLPLDIEAFKKPLLIGWKRELVKRARVADEKKKKQSDAYYYAPCGTKFRSGRDIEKYLSMNPSFLTTANFYFGEKMIGLGEPYECQRDAARRIDKISSPLKTKKPRIKQDLIKPEDDVETPPLQNKKKRKRKVMKNMYDKYSIEDEELPPEFLDTKDPSQESIGTFFPANRTMDISESADSAHPLNFPFALSSLSKEKSPNSENNKLGPKPEIPVFQIRYEDLFVSDDEETEENAKIEPPKLRVRSMDELCGQNTTIESSETNGTEVSLPSLTNPIPVVKNFSSHNSERTMSTVSNSPSASNKILSSLLETNRTVQQVKRKRGRPRKYSYVTNSDCTSVNRESVVNGLKCSNSYNGNQNNIYKNTEINNDIPSSGFMYTYRKDELVHSPSNPIDPQYLPAGGTRKTNGKKYNDIVKNLPLLNIPKEFPLSSVTPLSPTEEKDHFASSENVLKDSEISSLPEEERNNCDDGNTMANGVSCKSKHLTLGSRPELQLCSISQ